MTLLTCFLTALTSSALIDTVQSLDLNLYPEWVSVYGAGAYNVCYDLAIDQDGNTYTVGCQALNRDNQRNARTIKYDPSGNIEWIAIFTSPGDFEERGFCIEVDPMGDIVIACTYGGFPANLALVKYTSSGGEVWTSLYDSLPSASITPMRMETDSYGNIFLLCRLEETDTGCITMKFDSNGVLLWENLFYGEQFLGACAVDMVLDQNNCANVTCYSNCPDGTRDYGTFRYTPEGVLLWTSFYDSPDHNDDVPQALDVDSLGNVYVIGCSKRNGTDYDCTMVKINNLGFQLWESVYYSGPSIDIAVDVTAEAYNCIYTTNTILGAYPYYNYNILTTKLSPQGDLLWSDNYNGPSNNDDEPIAIEVGTDGNIYVGGSSFSYSTSWDFVLLKYLPSGNREYAGTYDYPASPSSEMMVGMALDSVNCVYIAGDYSPNFQVITLKYNENVGIETPASSPVPDESLEFTAFPNPADGLTCLRYRLREQESVRIMVIDVAGREIYSTTAVLQDAGNHETMIEFPNTGLFFCTIEHGNSTHSIPVVSIL